MYVELWSAIFTHLITLIGILESWQRESGEAALTSKIDVLLNQARTTTVKVLPWLRAALVDAEDVASHVLSAELQGTLLSGPGQDEEEDDDVDSGAEDGYASG